MVDNQHEKIKGYRDLSEAEIALMNEGKHLAEQCRAYTDKLSTLKDHTGSGQSGSVDPRWLSIGITDIQTGFMALIRSIARPTTF